MAENAQQREARALSNRGVPPVNKEAMKRAGQKPVVNTVSGSKSKGK